MFVTAVEMVMIGTESRGVIIHLAIRLGRMGHMPITVDFASVIEVRKEK